MKKAICVFCAAEKLSDRIWFKNNYFYVLKNHNPIAQGHCMVIPYRHIREEIELNAKEWRSYLDVCEWTVTNIYKQYRKDALVFINAPSDQSVFHLHKHYIPSGGLFGKLKVEGAIRKLT